MPRFDIPNFAIPILPVSRNDEDFSDLRYELPSYDNPCLSIRSRYASPGDRPLHEFALAGPDKRPWVMLRFRSRAASAKSLPVFFEGQEVSGHVILDLRQAENIKSAEVSIIGFVRTLSKETNFFRISQTLWNGSFGHPRSPNLQSGFKYQGKLEGAFIWDFSFALPMSTGISPKLSKELSLSGVERLPPSLDRLGLDSVINYRLSVSIKRRGLLNPDSILSTLVGYTPSTQPDPPSDARLTAYTEGTLIPGPVADPNGWRVLRSISIRGKIFKQREVSATYSLALATPLSYTCGTVIPLHLTIKSSDEQALALLSSPLAPRVTLHRKCATRIGIAPAERADLTLFHNERPLSRAIWAPENRNESPDGGMDGRCLMGELGIPATCTPSFTFGEFKLEYFVDVHPPSPAGFHPPTEGTLLSTSIQIVSDLAEDVPSPRAYITPAQNASHRVARAHVLGSGRNVPAALTLE